MRAGWPPKYSTRRAAVSRATAVRPGDVDVTITSGAHESRACRRADQDISMVQVLVATSDAGYLAIEARTR